jgi:hypothetical protein
MNELTTSSIAPQGLINIGDMNPEAQVSITVEGYKQMCARIAELEAENAALKDAQRWIPVGERLPEEAQEIYAREYNGIFTHFKYSKRLYEIFIRHYTHWRPLPQPPEAE